MMEPTKIDLIIPTLNAAPYLEKLIKSLKSQKQPVDRIIVIDSGSTDKTTELALNLQAEVIKIDPQSFDHGATRNLAADHSTAEILIYMTQDAVAANSETIGHLIAPLQEKKTIAAYARQLAAKEASPSEKFLRLANYPPETLLKEASLIPQLGIKTFQNSNVCAAYRREEFEKLGRFPQPVVCNEDMLFAARAIFSGYRVAYCAEATVYHTHQLSLTQLFRRYFDIGASLSHDPRISKQGQAIEKGFEFLKNQLNYLKKQGKLIHVPLTLLETAAKYIGYQAGVHHTKIPSTLKKHLGANSLYWSKAGR